MYFQNSLIVLLTARTILSLVGMVLLVVGNWSWNRDWDLHRATETAVGDEYQAMEKQETPLPPRINKLAAAGWTLLAVAYLLDRKQPMAWDEDGLSIVHYLDNFLLVAVGILQSYFVPRAFLNGTMPKVQVLYVSMIGLSLLTIGSLNAVLYEASPSWMGPVGAICVTIAPYFIYIARRKGEPRETDGMYVENAMVIPADIPENRVYVFNLGGPLLVVGWFLWWLSMNCVKALPQNQYIQLYITNRTYVAFAGAALVLIVYWMVGYALDASAPMNDKEDALNMVKNAPAFGVGKVFFGESDEIPVAMIFCWGLFGFSAFWPYIAGWEPFAVFALFLFVGYSMAKQQTAGIREKDVDAVSRWSRCIEVGILLSTLVTGFYGQGSAVVFMLLGLLGISYGSLALHGDRKIGWAWLQQEDASIPPMSQDRPQVFSYGALAFPLGLICLAWGLSMLPY